MSKTVVIINIIWGVLLVLAGLVASGLALIDHQPLVALVLLVPVSLIAWDTNRYAKRLR